MGLKPRLTGAVLHNRTARQARLDAVDVNCTRVCEEEEEKHVVASAFASSLPPTP